MPLIPEPARHIRPLPRTLRPVHHETIDSYIARLATANALPAKTLLTYLGATPGRRNQALLQRLATASRQPPASLFHALVEFQYLGTGTPSHQTAFPRAWNYHGVALPACQPCMATRGITTTVVIFIPSYQRVCRQHCRWLDRRQIDLVNAPEIVQAHRRHRWIARRHGRRNATNAYGDAAHIVDRWIRRGDPSRLHQRWAHRLTSLAETRRVLDFDDPELLAAIYPETVALSSILSSRHWTSMATSDHAAQRERFYEETARRLDLPSVRPSDSYDPLFRWSDDLRLKQARLNETTSGEQP